MKKNKYIGVFINGRVYLDKDLLLKHVEKCKKAAIKSYKENYTRKIKEWCDSGEDVNIRAEQGNRDQTAKNIAHARDAIVDTIKNIG